MESFITFLTVLTAFIVAITGIITAFLNLYKETQKSIPKKIKEQSEVDNLILNKMEDIKEILDADRIQIYDFHNGIHYANGRSALKFSCSYEVVKAGIKPLQIQLQNIPSSVMPRFIKELLSKGKMGSLDIETLKEIMPSLYSIKTYQGVKSFYDITLNNKYGEPVGILSIQYNKIQKEPYTEKEKKEIERLKMFVEEELLKIVD